MPLLTESLDSAPQLPQEPKTMDLPLVQPLPQPPVREEIPLAKEETTQPKEESPLPEEETAVKDDSAAPAAEPSKIVGPQLVPAYTNALELFRDSFSKFNDKLAVAAMYQPADYLSQVFDETTAPQLINEEPAEYLRWSFGQLRVVGELLAAALAAKGVTEGMTIAALAKGSVQFYTFLHAALILRCRFSPMNPQAVSNAGEIESMLNAVSANVVVSWDSDLLDKLDTSLPDLSRKLVLKVAVGKPEKEKESLLPANRFEYYEDLVLGALPLSKAQESLKRFDAIETQPDDIAVILFTSGTSSFPKACPLTHRGLCAISQNFTNGPTGGPKAVICNHLPIYHIAGGISSGWNPLTSGAAVIHPAAQFTAKSTLDAMRIENVTFMILVPSMIGLLTSDDALPPPGELSIRSVSLGASTILYTDVEKCYEFLGANRVITSYGMTEGLMMTRGHLPREVTQAARDGIQQVCPGARLKICEPNSRTIVPRGQAGEVHQGGATTINGYLGKESDAFYEDEDGIWCMTGDQAIMHPDGGVQITGRYKDLIIRGGVNVSPQAIEGVISRILRLEAHVVGMPDSIAGEVPVAIVRKSDVGKASISRLREPIIKELGPRFALEKFISLEELGLEDFPRTSTGKIRKVDLQSAVKRYAQAQNTVESGPVETSGKPTIERLMDLWTDVAGISLDDCTPQTSVHDLADSLMLARYASMLRQVFGVPVSLNDLNKAGTLAEQAEMLDERKEEDSTNADLVDDREGPPNPADMVHTEEDVLVALQTRRAVENVIEPLGFTWDDVQDVITPSQWLQSWVKSRATSDRFRAAYISKEADVPTFAAAFVETLRRNDSLRALSVPKGDTTDIQAILRHTDKWLAKVVHIREDPVETPADLERLIPGNYDLRGGLTQVIIAHVKSTNSAGVCIMTLHTTFDAFSLDVMRKDLNLLLNKKKPKQHVPYKLWADHLYNQRDSAQAKAAVLYNARRLKGLAKNRHALWPPQRTPVWQRGCDRGLDVTYDGAVTTPEDPARRPLLDGPPENCIGSTGIRRSTVPEDLAVLAREHGVPAPVIVKAALSMLETRQTGHSTALFSQTFAMRDNWPFVDAWMSRRMPAPLEVTGPTLARIAEIIPVPQDLSVIEWLQQLKSEQDELIKHAHAPYRNVYDELNRRSEEPFTNGHPIGHNKLGSDHFENFNGFHGSTEDNRALSESINDIPPDMPQIRGIDDLELRTGRSSGSSSLVARSPKESAIEDGDAVPDASQFLSIRDERRLSSSSTLTFTSTADEPSLHAHFLPRARDGDVMESIRQRINLQWLPIFGANDKTVKPLVRFVNNSHFNEVGLAVKSGMLDDHKTIWVKMEWDDGNIRSSETTAWIEEMIGYIAALGRRENWKRPVGEVFRDNAPAPAGPTA